MLHEASIVAITNYQKLSGLEPQKCIIIDFLLSKSNTGWQGWIPSGGPRGESISLPLSALEAPALPGCCLLASAKPESARWVPSLPASRWLRCPAFLFHLLGPLWVSHLENPRKSPHLKSPNIITSAKSLLHCKVTVRSQGPGIRTWTSLRGPVLCLPHLPKQKPGRCFGVRQGEQPTCQVFRLGWFAYSWEGHMLSWSKQAEQVCSLTGPERLLKPRRIAPDGLWLPFTFTIDALGELETAILKRVWLCARTRTHTHTLLEVFLSGFTCED